MSDVEVKVPPEKIVNRGSRGLTMDPSDLGGLNHLINKSTVSYERLPMLEVVFDRLVRTLTTSLRNLTLDNVEIDVEGFTAIRFGEYINKCSVPSLLGVFKIYEWNNHGLISIDRELSYMLIESLLGGARNEHKMEYPATRAYTTIEISLVEFVMSMILEEFTKSFEPVKKVNFILDRLESNPRFAGIEPANNASILVPMRVEMGNRSGFIEFVIPYGSLEPVRNTLLQMFMGEKFGRDAIWEDHLVEEVWETEVDLEAVLAETWFRLNEVLEWKVGNQLDLNTMPDSPIILRCGNRPMFHGTMGQKAGVISIRIENILFNEEVEDGSIAANG